MILFFLQFSPLTIGNNPCPTCKPIQFQHVRNFAGCGFEYVSVHLRASKETDDEANHQGNYNLFFHLLLFSLSLLIDSISGIARGAEGRRVPIDRLVNQSGLVATTAAAAMSLGLRALGSCLHQSEHPQSSSQLRHCTLPLLRYDVSLPNMSQHLLWRGVPLDMPLMLLICICRYLLTEKLCSMPRVLTRG